MTLTLMVATLLGAMTAGQGAAGNDLGFRYDSGTGRCERNGEAGHNPGFLGECGDLTRASLFGRNLRRANLRGAILFKANLARADLTLADLTGARLAGAYLYRAKLARADLRGAAFNLHLQGADLFRVDLAGARFDGTTRLPFSSAEARRRRMVATARPVAVVPAPSRSSR